MTHIRSLVRSAAIALVVAPVAHAQVGTLPERSPFRDVEGKHELALFGGLGGGRDAVGAAPNGGLALGVRYDFHVTGPALLTARLVRQGAERDILNTRGVPPASRVAGTVSQALYLADVGVTLNLTGRKSWRNVVPSVTAGLGLATDFRGASDSSQFRFGNRFALQVGGGVKWHARGRYTVRADLVNYLYNVAYPGTFRIAAPAAGEQPILPITAGLSRWTRNSMLTIGVSRHFGR